MINKIFSISQVNKQDRINSEQSVASLMAQWVKNLPAIQETQETWV